MKGKAVVVLHGLVRSRASMDSLCRYLREKGGYQVFNVEYPSTQDDMAEHARSLRHIIDNLDGIEEINFVGHSMGNIVVRHYLGDLARQDPLKQSANAAAADRRAKMRFRPVRHAGAAQPGRPAGRRRSPTTSCSRRSPATRASNSAAIGPSWKNAWPRPTFEFGIIAGGKGNDKGYNPLLPGDNDGVISVETAKLAGARDFVRRARAPLVHHGQRDRSSSTCSASCSTATSFPSNERHPLEKTRHADGELAMTGHTPSIARPRGRHRLRTRCGSASPSATPSGRSPARWKTTPAAARSKTPSGSAGWRPRRAWSCSSSGCRSILDGGESQKSLEARQFGQWLAETTGVPVEFFDERFTSVEAEQFLLAADMTRKRRKKRMDMLAAQIMLSAYLESLAGREEGGRVLYGF